MTNFSFLSQKPEYALFAPACMEAEKILSTAPSSSSSCLSSSSWVIWQYIQSGVYGPVMPLHP